MQRADAFAAELGVDRYLQRCRLKTAVLFRAACELGSLQAAGPTVELASFGERIGLAFQILDDVLDVTGPPERTGKPRGADLLDGTITLPLIVARQRDAEIAGLDLGRVRTSDDAAVLCDRIAATGALDDARSQALELVMTAKQALPSLPRRQRSALELVADGVVERYT
jgi:geranylgeranyl pyrophosphate synthase